MKKERARIGAYVLPNIITTGNLFFGFFSIIKSINGDYRWAASAILVAAIFDMLDGRVARLTKGTSEFGLQYDSLCDLVSFGLAPAILAFKYGLHEFGRLGWIVSFVFIAAGALRLARFNVHAQREKEDSDDFFQGLPIPMAGLIVSSLVLFNLELKSEIDFPTGNIIIAVLADFINRDFLSGWFLILGTFYAAVCMVSSFRFFSHKSFHLGAANHFHLLGYMVIAIATFAYQPELFGFIIAVVYAISGPIVYLISGKLVTKRDEIFDIEYSEGSES